jgi:eukaryotic-like serine/threonine-protein kinase
MRHRFGEFVLDLEASRLEGPGGEIRLRPQAFRMLEVLVERAPRILSQEELLDRVWGVEHLSPASVKQAVSEVRQALGDDPARPRLIETVHRRGYRFIAPLEIVETPQAPQARETAVERTDEPARPFRFRRALTAALAILAIPSLAGIAGIGLLGRSLPQQSPLPAALMTGTTATTARASAAAARRTVAILGFKNLSADPETAWMSGAFAEILGFELAAPGRLRVIPGENVARMRRELALPEETPSPASLSRIGRNLGTDFVILGSYLLTGDGHLRVQVLVQDVRTGETVAWARQTGAAGDLNRLATAAARGLLGTFSDGRPGGGAAAEAASLAANAESLRLYSEAQSRLRVWDGPAAVRLLEQAAQTDPQNPFVLDSLATGYEQLGFARKAAETAQQALALVAPGNAQTAMPIQVPREARLAIEGHAHALNTEWDQAAASYAALWQLYPDDLEHGLSLALVQRKAGKTEESLATVAALRKLAPPAGDDPRIDLLESDGAWQLGDFGRARDSAARGIAKAQARGAVLIVAAGRFSRGYASKRLGDNAAALADFRVGHDLYQKMGDRGAAAGMLTAEAFVLQSQGKTAAARRAYEQAIPIFRETGDRSREAKTLNNFAALIYEEGDAAGVIPLLERSLAIKREIGDLQGSATTLVNMGNMLAEKGDARGARPRLEEALGISRRLEDTHGTALALRGLSRVHAREGRFDDGRAALAEALALSRRSGDAEGTAQAALALGDLERKAGLADPARAAYREAIQEFGKIEEAGNAATAMINLADLDVSAGRIDSARALYGQTLKMALDLASPLVEASSRYGLGLTAARRGDAAGARTELEKSIALFEKLGDAQALTAARKELAGLASKLLL